MVARYEAANRSDGGAALADRCYLAEGWRNRSLAEVLGLLAPKGDYDLLIAHGQDNPAIFN
jgi:hypothetical protein